MKSFVKVTRFYFIEKIQSTIRLGEFMDINKYHWMCWIKEAKKYARNKDYQGLSHFLACSLENLGDLFEDNYRKKLFTIPEMRDFDKTKLLQMILPMVTEEYQEKVQKWILEEAGWKA